MSQIGQTDADAKKAEAAAKLTALMNKALLLGAAFTVLGFCLLFFKITFAKEALIVGIGTLVNVFIFRGVAKRTFNGYLSNFSVSIILLALLFNVCHFNNATEMAYAGIFAAVVYALTFIRNAFKPNSENPE